MECEYSYIEVLFIGILLLNGLLYVIIEFFKSYDVLGFNSVSLEDWNSGGFGKLLVDKNEDVYNK